MRLIDVDALGIGLANPDVFQDRAYADGWNSAVQLLNVASTVDAIPVVRCRECKYSHCYDESNWECLRYSGSLQVSENDFCSYGERRD